MDVEVQKAIAEVGFEDLDKVFREVYYILDNEDFYEWVFIVFVFVQEFQDVFIFFVEEFTTDHARFKEEDYSMDYVWVC